MHFCAVILGFHRSAPIAIIVASSSSPFPLSPLSPLSRLFHVVAIATLPRHPSPLYILPLCSSLDTTLFLFRSCSRTVVSFVAPITSRTALIKLVTRISLLFSLPVASSLLIVVDLSRDSASYGLLFLRFSAGRSIVRSWLRAKVSALLDRSPHEDLAFVFFCGCRAGLDLASSGAEPITLARCLT